MAISLSSYELEQDKKDELMSKTIDPSNFGSDMFGGQPLVGITAEFATAVSGKIEEYEKTIKEKLGELQEAKASGAFKGASVEPAIEHFVVSVKELADSYVAQLSAAEQQIINSVSKAYSEQDTQVAGDIKTDSSTIEGEKFNVTT